VDCPVGPPKVEDPFDRFTWHESKAVLQPLGPHQESEIGPCAELNSDNVGGNALGLVPIYVIGEIRYFDNVEPKKERTTQFSKQVRFLGEDVSHLNGRVVSVGKHNCADDDCVARRSE
jgi:hypothetical protein